MTGPGHMLTASGTALAAKCAYPFRLDAKRARDDERWAWNQATHAVLAHTITTKDESLAIPPELEPELTDGEIGKVRNVHTAWLSDWWDEQRDGQWEAEVPLVIDPRTGAASRLVRGAHRDYSSAPAGSVPGTADVLRVTTELADIIDWKSGFLTPDAVDNAQLKTLGCATGAEHVRAGIGRVDEDGVQIEWTEFDALDLFEHRQRLADLVASIPIAEPRPGPHCREMFCESFGLCPATEYALEHVSPEAKRRLPVVMTASEIRDADHAAAMYHDIRAAKAALEAISKDAFAALQEWASQHGGVSVGGGKVWIRYQASREAISLDSPGAVEALRRELGDHFEAAVTRETSKAAIKKAARAIKAQTKEPITHVEKRALDALRAVNAVRASTGWTWGERKIGGGADDALAGEESAHG